MVQTGLKNINHVPWYVYLFFIRYICSYFKYIIKQVNIGVDNNENNLLIFFYSLKIHQMLLFSIILILNAFSKSIMMQYASLLKNYFVNTLQQNAFLYLSSVISDTLFNDQMIQPRKGLDTGSLNHATHFPIMSVLRQRFFDEIQL